MTDTTTRIKKIILGNIVADEDKISDNADLMDDLGADSLDVVELVMGIEEEFGIEIPDADVEKFRTVKDVVDYVEKAIA